MGLTREDLGHQFIGLMLPRKFWPEQHCQGLRMFANAILNLDHATAPAWEDFVGLPACDFEEKRNLDQIPVQ